MLTTNNANIRQINAYPYQGHTFICNDIIGVADVQEVFDSALHAIAVGNLAASGYTRMVNDGEWLKEAPVCGMTNEVPHYPRLWTSPNVVELVPQLNKYCIVVTARLQVDDFTIGNNLTGTGGRASWFDVKLAGFDAAGTPTEQLINRFYANKAFHQAFVPPPSRQTPTTVDIEWDSVLFGEQIKQFTITGTVNPSLFVNGSANVGLLTFGVDYPLRPLVNSWTVGEINSGVSVTVSPAPHPITGIQMECDGVIDFECYFYR